MEKTTIAILIAVILIVGGAIAFVNLSPPTDSGEIDNAYDPSATNVSFQTLKQGNMNAITQRQTRVVKTTQDWANLWTEMFPTEMIASAIKFDQRMVIAVFAGEKGTGGYTIEITKILEKENELEVFVIETSPGTGCFTTQALTQPYHIVETKKSDKPVKFTFENKVSDCA